MIQPLYNYILIKEVDEYREKLEQLGMVYDGEKKKNETGKGVIVALGSESKDLEVGDIIYFNRYIPQEIVVDKEKYLTLPRKDVQAKEIN